MDYKIKFMKKRPDADEVVAEMDVTDSKAGPKATADHHAKFAKIFMRHIRFDYAVAEPLK